MKKINYLALASIAALAMGSCSNDDMGLVGGSNELRVNGTINEIKTRATDTDFEADDVIGLIGTGIENVGYAYNGSAFAPQASAVKVADSNSISAYYPYTADLSADEISFNVASDENIDFLFAPAVTVTPDNPTANFAFSHKMSKLKITVVDADNQFTAESLTLTLSNVATTGKFNPSTGLVSPDAANGTLSSAIEAGTPMSFIVPSYAEANTAAIVATVGVSNGDFYVANITPALAAGTQYNVSLTIKKNNPDLNVGGSITDWEHNEMGDVDMGKGEKPYTLAVGDFLLKSGKTVEPTAENASTYESDIVGVVYFVGNPQPSTLYSSVVTADKDILKAEASEATRGLAIAVKNANENAGRFSTSKDQIYTDWLNSSDPAYPSVAQIFIPSAWNTGNTTPTQLSGYNNTRIFQLAAEDKSYDMSILNNMLSDYQNSNAVSNASNWYLPSYGEFSEIYKNYDVIVASLAKVDAELPAYDDTTDTSAPTAENFYWTSDFRNATNQFVSVLKPVSNIGRAILDKGSSANRGWFRLSVAF